MPLFDVECPLHHKHEILLSSSEVRALTADGRPDFLVPCPTEMCGEWAKRQVVSAFGATPVQWRRAANGGSSQ